MPDERRSPWLLFPSTHRSRRPVECRPPALGVVGDVFAHLSHPSYRTTSDLRFGQRNRVKQRSHCDIEGSWFACGRIGHQVVGWPASGTISLNSPSHLKLTTQASPVAELGNDITQAVVAQDSVPASSARQGMVTKRVQLVVRAMRAPKVW
eukprot:Em0034g34a